jgi:hypothetical protein
MDDGAFFTPHCHWSETLLAERVGVSRRTITRIKPRLVAKGWITWRRVWRPGQRWQNCVYTILAGWHSGRPLSDRMRELAEQVAVAKLRERELEVAAQRIADEVAELGERIIEAHAEGNDALGTKLSKARARAEGVGIRDASERLEGAKRAVQRAEVERSVYAAEHVDGLLAERKPDAEAAAQAVQDAVEALATAQKQWDAAQSDLATILRLAGRSSEGLPQFPPALADLVRSARRAQVDVPSPAVAS